MKNLKKLSYLMALLALSFAMTLTSCSDDDDDDTDTTTENQLSGTITTNTTLVASKKYTLVGNVFVQSGVTLTIEPGTIIFGDKASKGSLVIDRGATINAAGTADKPIIFTSSAPVGYRNYGDWGGVIVLGKAQNNQNPNHSLIARACYQRSYIHKSCLRSRKRQWKNFNSMDRYQNFCMVCRRCCCCAQRT